MTFTLSKIPHRARVESWDSNVGRNAGKGRYLRTYYLQYVLTRPCCPTGQTRDTMPSMVLHGGESLRTDVR